MNSWQFPPAAGTDESQQRLFTTDHHSLVAPKLLFAYPVLDGRLAYLSRFANNLTRQNVFLRAIHLFCDVGGATTEKQRVLDSNAARKTKDTQTRMNACVQSLTDRLHRRALSETIVRLSKQHGSGVRTLIPQIMGTRMRTHWI